MICIYTRPFVQLQNTPLSMSEFNHCFWSVGILQRLLPLANNDQIQFYSVTLTGGSISQNTKIIFICLLSPQIISAQGMEKKRKVAQTWEQTHGEAAAAAVRRVVNAVARLEQKHPTLSVEVVGGDANRPDSFPLP